MSGTTYLDLLTLAAGELNIVAIGDQLSDNPVLAQRLLDRLTWMVDSWNLKPTVVPWYQQQILPLRPNQQSYLIGPNAPDWNVPRPIRLDPNAANLLLLTGLAPSTSTISVNGAVGFGGPGISVNSAFVGTWDYIFVNGHATGNQSQLPPFVNVGSNVQRYPLAVLSVQQWANISLPYLANTFPQGCYLDRAVVTGTNFGAPYTASRIWVWGVPTTANYVELFYWQQLTAGNLSDPVNAAPGYFRAMFLNLALEIAPMFGASPSALTARNGADALGDIKELNAPDMTMQPDPGMPGSRSGYITRAQFISGNI